MVPHVLVVEDHPLYRNTFCQLLHSCVPHVHIVTAADGSSALQYTQQQSFDLLIVDYQLPTISGGDIIRRWRSRAVAMGQALPPIVLMSSQPDVAVFARSLGVAAFLPKPADAEAIEHVVVPLLTMRSAAVGTGSTRLWRVQPRQT